MLEQAIEKLTRERKEKSGLGRAGQFMAEPVADALMEFCRQDEEFAQAVVQGGSFTDCMKAVEKNCGTAISDPEALRRAARFYFPGAEVHTFMTIDLVGTAADSTTPVQGGGIVLNLSDFL